MRDAHNDRLLTKKEVEVTMNRMRRQMEEQRKVKSNLRILEKKPCSLKLSSWVLGIFDRYLYELKYWLIA